MNYVNSLDGVEKCDYGNRIPKKWRAADFGKCYSSDNCFGLAIFDLNFQHNKKGTEARKLVKERFFTESGYRRDMTEEKEREIVLMRIQIAKENAGNKSSADKALSTETSTLNAAQQQWEQTHLCGDLYSKQHCEYLIQADEDTVLSGKKLDSWCPYCTSENKVRKIGSAGMWTGLSPKFCPKRKALEQNNKNPEQHSMCDDCANNDGSCIKPTEGECVRYVSENEATSYFPATSSENETAKPTYFDVFLQHYPNFDVSRFDEFADDVCVAECFDDVNGCLGNTAGKHDTACKISCSECWKNVCKLQWEMLDRGTEKYIEPYLKTAEKQEDTMTPNFNFKGFISEGNQLKQVPLDMLVPYHNHKFKLYEGERLDDMVNSIKENGVLTPIIVRNMGGEHYEILAGHNRTNAAKLAGLSVIPAIVKENLSDDEAEMYVIETNVMQRGFDDLSISERAAVVAARHSAMFDEDKRKAIERELAILNGDTPADEIEEQEKGEKKSKLAAVGESYGLSKDSVARLIRISKLAPEIQVLVDNGGIPLRAGVNLSYLLASEQKMLVKCMTTGCEVKQLSMKQSELLRGLSHNKKFTENNMRQIVLFGKLSADSEDAPRKPIRVKISADIGAKYFAPDWGADKVQEIVELALERYFTDTDHTIMDDNDEYQM
ncbi:MAG: ParB/RepB/Spo0J family partition protein [Oscillospiraceae bacterium]|nr:ParB/RepB/Spo0J family partition protein [Oscillospiraceae bacterium]